jgi:hypothetical protein
VTGARLAWRRALVAAVGLRLAVAVVTVVAPALIGAGTPVPVAAAQDFAGWTAAPATGLDMVGAGLERFDALWYLAIAADGYPTTATTPPAAAFFPGFPALVALVGAVTGGRLLLAAHLVAFMATVAALAGVHELAREAAMRWGRGDATALAGRAVVLLATFPTAFFLVAPYSESTFLATSAWGLVAAGRGRWRTAGLLGLAAATLRPLGGLVALPILLAPALLPGLRSRRDRRGALLAATGPCAGFLAVAGVAWARWGSPTAVLEVQGAWQRRPAWPWDTLYDAVRSAWIGLEAGLGWWALDLLVFVPVLVAVLWLARRDRWLGIYAGAHVAVWFIAPFPDRPLLSVPRFAVAVAPLAVAIAAWTGRRAAFASAVALQSGLLALHLALFTTWGLVF